MSYRDFVRTAELQAHKTTRHWLNWMENERDLLVPVAPQHPLSCSLCFGASSYRDAADVWDLCWNCRSYGNAVDRLVPMAYSIDAGLESMLHRFKDRNVRWLGHPLASLLHRFLRHHAECIERSAGGIDVALTMPSDNQRRTFDHLDVLLNGVRNSPAVTQFDWHPGGLVRDRSQDRPGRGALTPEAYRVEVDVSGATVLLFDDLWTSGSSAASCAAALKAEGAIDVTVLTLGRQLSPANGFGSTVAIYEDRLRTAWSVDECVLCA